MQNFGSIEWRHKFILLPIWISLAAHLIEGEKNYFALHMSKAQGSLVNDIPLLIISQGWNEWYASKLEILNFHKNSIAEFTEIIQFEL